MTKNGNRWVTNNWWKILTAAVVIFGGYAVLTYKVEVMEPKVDAHSKAIVENEKSIIKMEGKMDTIRVQQEAYHEESAEKLNEILSEVRK